MLKTTGFDLNIYGLDLAIRFRV